MSGTGSLRASPLFRLPGFRPGLAGRRAPGPGTCTLTLAPSFSLSTPVITASSPGSIPERICDWSPSVVPTVISRTVTVESGFTSQTYVLVVVR